MGYVLLVGLIVVCPLTHVFCAEEKSLGDINRNFLRNGSFEVGWCNEIGRMTCPNDSKIPDASWITDKVAYHGRYCLKLAPVEPFYGRRIGLQCFTIPVCLPGTGLYHLSLWAKAIQGKAMVTIQAMHPHTSGETTGIKAILIKDARAMAEVNTQRWTQLKVSVPASGNKKVYLEISGENVYVDAIEFLKGETPVAGQGAPPLGEAPLTQPNDLLTLIGDDAVSADRAGSFIPAAVAECGIWDDLPGNIHYREDPLCVAVRLYNNADHSQSAAVVYELMNQENAIVLSGEREPVTVPARGYHVSQWKLPPVSHGKYSLKYWVKGGEAAWGEHVFTVMPAPAPGLRAPTGLLVYLTPDVVKLMKRAGLSYYGSLDDTIRLENNYDCETGKLDDLSSIIQWGAEADLVMFLSINPAWWPRKAKVSWNELMPSRHPSPPPDPKTYFDALEKCAKLYAPYIKRWWIQDELEGHYHPHEFLPVFNQTVEVIRKHRPDAEFFISAMGSWVDQFARVGGLKNLDWIGGSVMGQGGDKGRKLGWLVFKHHLKMYADAGGFTTFRPFSRLRGGQVHASWTLHNSLINSFFLHHAQGSSMYRANPAAYDWTMVHDPYNVFEADGSMTCGLTLYAIAGQILAGGEAAFEPLQVKGNHGHFVWPFMDGGSKRPAVCFFPGYERTVTLDLSPDQVELRDRLGNPLQVIRGTDGKTQLKLAKQHYFLYGVGIEAQPFHEAVRNSTTDNKPAEEDLESFAYCVPDDTQTVKIAVTTVNRKDKKQEKEIIDSLYPYKEGFPLRAQQIVRKTAEGQPWVWLSTARRVASVPVIDGHLEEWQPEISSAIYYSNYVLSEIDGNAIHAHQDAFKIACDIGMDYRVEWFTGYDQENLYFCARVFDDQLVAADHPEGGRDPDRIELRFDRDVEGDLLKPSDHDDFVIWLTPDQEGKALRMEIEDAAKGKRNLDAAKGTMAIWDDPHMLRAWEPWVHPGPTVGYLLEAAIPWPAIGLEPKPGLIFGFDVFGHDTDMVNGLRESSVLRWAGRARPTGQLRLSTRTVSLRD